MKIVIIGAGMAGLLAGQLLRHHHDVVIYEAQDKLPNNHTALLRFRTPAIGDILGVRFKQVQMVKASLPYALPLGNPIGDILSYSKKCTGYYRSDRSILSTGTESHQRFIAPTDLIKRLSKDLNIQFNCQISKITINVLDNEDTKIISTAPMPALLAMLEIETGIQFSSVLGVNINCDLGPSFDAYVSLYVPNMGYQFHRLSITGQLLTIEFAFPGASMRTVEEHLAKLKQEVRNYISSALNLLGAPDFIDFKPPEVSIQRYAKILPIDEDLRRHTLASITDQWKIYQLGRFATWRPRLLLDDLINDVRVITRLMEHPYDRMRFDAAG